MDLTEAAIALAELHRSGDAPDGRRIIDYAEAERVGGWTLRSALVRFAQPEPVRASAVLELVRRTDGALHGHRTGQAPDDEEPGLVPLLTVALALDRLGDVLAEWAVDITAPRPSAVVDEIAADAFARLADLGVPRETRPSSS